MITPLPSYPWERIAADLFELKGSTYLLVTDYYSRFVEVQRLTTTTSSTVVRHLKTIFARLGIPTTMVTDNGPQFDSQEMKEFAHNIQSLLPTSQWACRKNGKDCQETVRRYIHGTTQLSCNTFTLVWAQSSGASHGEEDK